MRQQQYSCRVCNEIFDDFTEASSHAENHDRDVRNFDLIDPVDRDETVSRLTAFEEGSS